MRSQWIAVVAALVFLGGCDSANQNGAGAPGKNGAPAAPAIAPGTTINGTVTLHDPIPVAQGAKLDVKLVDVAQPEVAIAEKEFEVGGAPPPYTFALDFDPGKIAATRTYVVNALMTDGPRRFVPALSSPVLTHGSGTTVQVVMNAEATPAEKLKEEYKKLQAHIGGMKKVDGTYTTDTASIAWDAFSEAGAVRYVRVNTVLDAGGRSAVFYAFTKDGKPMMVQQKGGSEVGWGEDGHVLVNEKSGGGTVADAEIKSMSETAAKTLQMAQEKVDAGKRK
ncbi:YbaY family lipoprotein [Dokdonella sp.]|uniref:YbaY family lipoprotein n=1 Tax=Dokdonella sp. TaxID=2291710 RepID=UPI001B2CC369|nr:YbaY family lipoprotein [Dokdonella sp.]MBO9661543.1 YbaY family lipoprotein [Dokdonella sp.]